MFKFQNSIIILLLFSATFAKDGIGSFFVGLDFLPNNEYNQTRIGVYKLSRNGLSFGVNLPINLPKLDYCYRIKFSKHEIADRAWDWKNVYEKSIEPLYDKHLSVLNELLIGKELNLHKMLKLSMLPQLGIGVLLDALYQDGDSNIGGIVYHCLYLDGSMAFRYCFKNIGMGILFNYQKSIRSSWDGYTATDRICLSYLVFK